MAETCTCRRGGHDGQRACGECSRGRRDPAPRVRVRVRMRGWACGVCAGGRVAHARVGVWQVPDYSSYEVLEERLRVAVLYRSQGFTFA